MLIMKENFQDLMPNLEKTTSKGDSTCENKEYEETSSKIEESIGSNNYESEHKQGNLLSIF